jgi:hypothetical protein
MNRIGQLKDGQLLTAGEKALVVMILAGIFGYCAGFNLSTPGDAAVMPVTSVVAEPAPAAHPAAASIEAPRAARAGLATHDAPARDASPAPTF